ncbi:protein-tyrosine phosphatase-like protein [Tricladium varicosporioides]|nr:protein-tyrosine phosphatase-like protein [Hymenoscyphus varicosporioides]
MDRFRTSSKRAHSPDTPPNENESTVSQMDGSCFGKPAVAADDEPAAKIAGKPGATAEPDKPDSPEMPEFLKLTEIETKDKYAELVRLENERLAAGKGGGEWSRLDPDPVLDRYNNIHPWANNRIKLHVPEGVNDYINASPVTLVSTASKQSNLKKGIQDKYICMQGPKSQTVDHVWHMVWHELATPYNSSPAIVIMLSPTHGPSPDDPNKTIEKCFPYYPVDEKSGPIIINEKSELGEEFKGALTFVSREPGIPGTSIEVRQFSMTVEGEDEEKPIWHYLYPNWPDFGALAEENVASILALMEISRKANGRGENPRLVHCSAGVGRTGTFVALEFLIGELLGGSWENWEDEHQGQDPVFETVNQLREQRKTMVQAYEQYAFLYEVLRKLWEEKYNTDCVGGEHGHERKAEVQRREVCDAE